LTPHTNGAGNSIQGTIPAELGQLTALKFVYVGYLREQELGAYPHILYRDLSQNQLRGSIPPDLKNCSILVTLYVHKSSLNNKQLG
jgi:hypothetical protein